MTEEQPQNSVSEKVVQKEVKPVPKIEAKPVAPIPKPKAPEQEISKEEIEKVIKEGRVEHHIDYLDLTKEQQKPKVKKEDEGYLHPDGETIVQNMDLEGKKKEETIKCPKCSAEEEKEKKRLEEIRLKEEKKKEVLKEKEVVRRETRNFKISLGGKILIGVLISIFLLFNLLAIVNFFWLNASVSNGKFAPEITNNLPESNVDVVNNMPENPINVDNIYHNNYTIFNDYTIYNQLNNTVIVGNITQ